MFSVIPSLNLAQKQQHHLGSARKDNPGTSGFGGISVLVAYSLETGLEPVEVASEAMYSWLLVPWLKSAIVERILEVCSKFCSSGENVEDPALEFMRTNSTLHRNEEDGESKGTSVHTNKSMFAASMIIVQAIEPHRHYQWSMLYLRSRHTNLDVGSGNIVKWVNCRDETANTLRTNS